MTFISVKPLKCADYPRDLPSKQCTTLARDYAPRVRAIEGAVVARDAAAVEAYDTLAAEAIDRMRSERPSGVLESFLGALDRGLYKNQSELLDDPTFPEAERARALDKLHQWNEQIGSYETFMQMLEPLFVKAERARPGDAVRIHDLAAGHGGFVLVLKQRYGKRLNVEASDIKEEYLKLGERRAAALGLDARFFVEDALAIEGPRERDADVLICTQAVHHFSPGMVGRMLGEATRAARVGVCFIDCERSWFHLVATSVINAVYGRSYVLWHDSIVSLRRMFYEEELGLLADLTPGLPPDARVETGIELPNHAFVRVIRAQK